MWKRDCEIDEVQIKLNSNWNINSNESMFYVLKI